MNINIDEIDIERLRKGLIEFYTGVMYKISPIAMSDIDKIEHASDEELVNIAIKNHVNLEEYRLQRRVVK